MDAPSMDAVHGLLALANDRHGMRWRLVGKLAGGYQQGAYELADLNGMRAVLKLHPAHLPAHQLIATARAVEDARLRGWPTPRWIAYGPLPADGAYIIEEFVEGERPTRLDGLVLDRLLDAIGLQADAQPQTDQDWSAYIQRVVFEGEADLAIRMRAHPVTATLQRRLEQMTAGALSNMLVRDDVPYVVDTAHAGKGTRAYDLATLLMETTVGGDHTPPSLVDQRRLERECVALVGREGFLVCVACRIMHLLVFGGVHRDEHVPRAVAGCNAFLDGLQGS